MDPRRPSANAPPAQRKRAAGPGSPGWEGCLRCLHLHWLCLCPDVPTVETRTRVVIVRHVSELNKSSNSGRAAALALRNSEVHDHGGPRGRVPEDALQQPGTWLLFPEGPARAAPPDPPPRRLVVLDGTWAQARHMRQRLPALRGLPILHLPEAPAAALRLREVPSPGHLSTIEAIAAALRLLEGEAPAAALEALFAQLVDRSRRTGRLMAGRSG